VADADVAIRDGRPVFDGAPVADIVHRSHEQGLEATLGAAIDDAAARARLEQALIYCAEKQCEADGVTCPGCRRDTEARGLTSFDDYCRQFSRITFTDGDLALTGPEGKPEHRANSLAELARAWAGEDYWFWARRTLRKLRYGVRKSEQLFSDDRTADAAPAAILMEPQIAENIGMVARAMANFGLDDLRVVRPRDGWPSEKARAVASGAAAILDGAGLHPTLESAMADCQYVVATTARQRDMRKPILTPEAAGAEIRRRTAAGQRCAILYGRERNGLQSDEVAMAHAIVMIPVNPAFASLNLAQSVLLTGYAWLRSGDDATLGRVTANDRRLAEGLHLGHDVPAKHEDVMRFFEHLEQELGDRGFFTPPERRHVTVRGLRSMFLRMGATAQEIRTLRGIIATLTRRERRNQNDG
jgi:tRNA/rRNA methyltransferase